MPESTGWMITTCAPHVRNHIFLFFTNPYLLASISTSGNDGHTADFEDYRTPLELFSFRKMSLLTYTSCLQSQSTGKFDKSEVGIATARSKGLTKFVRMPSSKLRTEFWWSLCFCLRFESKTPYSLRHENYVIEERARQLSWQPRLRAFPNNIGRQFHELDILVAASLQGLGLFSIIASVPVHLTLLYTIGIGNGVG